MTDNEKYNLLSKVLRHHHVFIERMTDEQLYNYVESMSMFLKTDDTIHVQTSIGNMILIIEKIKMNIESELEAEVKEISKEPKPRAIARKITRLPENYKSKITIENEKLIRLLRRL